ncbi:dicarboxylate transporter/tellurite-resistance protein TehA [Bradyrhizobium sp. SRS-191]|uniref:dicarboxylate transporter/tellurite-resistance protein TehA n=1 Tax=Bradyrhizobium sp. SRS-191 TaxID=2962606 RepID=UPI00211ECEA7|nr:dicarboxylate transporter/tellurite-resistance protein TehA [Bradyrhizobium sp. SRS-191]
MTARIVKLPLVPASFFGIVLGIIGLGNSWRAAHQLWGLPAAVGEVLMAVGIVVWAVIVLFYVAKWIFSADAALSEALHPIQCCFIGLAGVSTMLVAIAAQPYSRIGALVIYAIGLVFTLGFALWRTGQLWRGGRDPAASTPVLYLPTVAGSFVTAIGAGALGFPDWGRLAFGAGLFSWLAVESVLLHRLYTADALPAAIRPTLGIQLAPPTVGALAYLSVTEGQPDMVVSALIGYGMLQLLLLVRLLPWILEHRLSASYWGFSFGLTALASSLLKMVIRGDHGPAATLAPIVFVVVNLVIGALVLRTIWLLVSGRILAPAVAPPQQA